MSKFKSEQPRVQVGIATTWGDFDTVMMEQNKGFF
jgi:hypothetical protein